MSFGRAHRRENAGKSLRDIESKEDLDQAREDVALREGTYANLPSTPRTPDFSPSPRRNKAGEILGHIAKYKPHPIGRVVGAIRAQRESDPPDQLRRSSSDTNIGYAFK